MNHRHPRYHDNFNHSNFEIGSRNNVRLSIGAIASSPAATILTVFVVALLIAALVWLWLTAQIVLQGLLAFGIGCLVWRGSMWCIATFSDTRARIEYNNGQKDRNSVLTPPQSPVTIYKDKAGNMYARSGYAEYRYHYDAASSNADIVDGEFQEIDPFEDMLKEDRLWQ